MFKPIRVKPLPNYRLWIEYDDGVAGEVDLSHLAGKGVFALWNDYAAFERVYIGDRGAIAWTEEIEICPDAVYMKIVRLPAEPIRWCAPQPDRDRAERRPHSTWC